MIRLTVARFRTVLIPSAPIIAMLLLGPAPLRAEQAAQPAPAAKLSIVIVEGEGAVNNIKQRTTRPVVVQVEDSNHRPVAGASVAFLLPGTGPGGSFAHGGKLATILTDQKGRAVLGAFRPNKVLGTFKINVTASLHGETATAAITQTNALAGAGIGAAGGSAAGGAAAGGSAGGAVTVGTAAATGLSAAAVAGIVAGVAAVGVAVAVGVAKRGGESTGPAAAAQAGTIRIGVGSGPIFVGPPH